MPLKRNTAAQKPIVYCIDGTTVVREAWTEPKPVAGKEAPDGTRDFLKWLSGVHAAPTHTSKAFSVVLGGEPIKDARKGKLKQGFDVMFAAQERCGKILIDQVRKLKVRQERVVLVSADTDLMRAAKAEGVRCITPQDFVMIFQAVI